MPHCQALHAARPHRFHRWRVMVVTAPNFVVHGTVSVCARVSRRRVWTEQAYQDEQHWEERTEAANFRRFIFCCWTSASCGRRPMSLMSRAAAAASNAMLSRSEVLRGEPQRVCLKKCISCLRPIAMVCTPCQCLVREGIIAQAASGQFADRSTDRPLDGKECGSTTCSPYVHACIHPLYSGMYAFPDQVHTYKPGVRRLAKWGTVQGLSRFD